MSQEYSEEKLRGTYGIINESKLDVEYHVCDLSSLKSVMKFVEWYKSTGRQVNILICNACTYTLSEGEKFWSLILLGYFIPLLTKNSNL